MATCMLTTTDNPYDPFDDFDRWYVYDESKGYHTCGYLDRIGLSYEDLSPGEESFVSDEILDDICEFNVLEKLGFNVSYVKVCKK